MLVENLIQVLYTVSDQCLESLKLSIPPPPAHTQMYIFFLTLLNEVLVVPKQMCHQKIGS